jgi:F420H(2)-dependent quinone reductase
LPEEQFLYLATMGWKTGGRHNIEIWFVEYGGKYFVMSEGRERAHWIQNLLHDPRVSFSVGGKRFAGFGKVIENNRAIASEVKKLMKKKYGWDSGMIVELTPN